MNDEREIQLEKEIELTHKICDLIGTGDVETKIAVHALLNALLTMAAHNVENKIAIVNSTLNVVMNINLMTEETLPAAVRAHATNPSPMN